MTVISIVGRKVTGEERRGYKAVSELVRSADYKPLNICEIHALLNPGRHYAGIIRQGDEEAAGVQRFYRTYASALKWNIGQDSVIIDWFIGAFGRCMRPFEDGNAAVFFFVENHLLQVHDLPWREKPLPHEVFLDFREFNFNQVFRKLIPQ